MATTSGIDRYLFSILKFTNCPNHEDLIIENCEDVSSELSNYCIVLDPSEKSALQVFLQGKFPEHSDEIANAFSVNNSDKSIIQSVKSYYYPDRLTDLFIEAYKGVDNLKIYGISGALDSVPDAVDEKVGESEEDEMVNKMLEDKNKELEETIKKYQIENEKLRQKLDDVGDSDSIEELKNELETLHKSIDELQQKLDKQESYYPKEEDGFTDETAGSFLECMNDMPEKNFKSLIFRVFMHLYETDVQELKRYIFGIFHVMKDDDK